MKPIITAFLIGILVCLAIRGCSEKTKPIDVKEIKTKIKTSGNLMETLNQKFQKEKQFLNRKTDSLKHENNKLSEQLQATRLLLQKQQKLVVSNIPCDTLRKDVVVLNQLSNAEDSLCERSIYSLNQAIAIKDSENVLCNENYKELYDLQKENQKRLLKLTDDLNTAYKQSRRKRFENKMLTCGLLIMSGITTTLFIKSTK